MKIIGIIFFLILLFVCCFSLNKRIEITSKYIINTNWNKKGEEIGANGIEVKRMKLKKDSAINPFMSLNQEDILNKLEVDSSFMYTANVKIKQGESYTKTKIYFDRDNGFDWWTDKGNQKTKILGRLKNNTWYEISRLNYYYYVVYIDSADKVHQFIINQANW